MVVFFSGSRAGVHHFAVPLSHAWQHWQPRMTLQSAVSPADFQVPASRFAGCVSILPRGQVQAGTAYSPPPLSSSAGAMFKRCQIRPAPLLSSPLLIDKKCLASLVAFILKKYGKDVFVPPHLNMLVLPITSGLLGEGTVANYGNSYKLCCSPRAG